jgi:kynureninase
VSQLDPAALRPHYSAFLRSGKVLLTGHSHQAWPDCARDATLEAWDDAASWIDDKWERAFAAADDVRGAVASRIGARADEIALGQNTHELVVRMVSALDLRARPRVVCTTGEFHSLTRQLALLERHGAVSVAWVEAEPVATLAERLAAAVDARTAAVFTSTVLFETSSVVPHLAELVSRARGLGAEVLLDAYHAFSVIPFDVAALGASDAFVVGGGYKYAQWGEGVCFLRVPPGRRFEPVLSGWFAGFGDLAVAGGARKAGFGPLGKDAFAGATYDPTCHYRARAVTRFMQEHGMTLPALRDLYTRQTARIIDGLDGLDVRTPRDPGARGGFVALRVDDASGLVAKLREAGVFTDSRGQLLRLGPAPYVTDDEIDRAVRLVRDAL